MKLRPVPVLALLGFGLLSLLSSISNILVAGISCPLGCNCATERASEADCQSLGLEGIPAELDPDTLSLLLANNSITSVSDDALGGLGELRTLDLSHNPITQVSVNAFRDLRELRFLDLSWNLLTSVPDNTFAALENVQLFYMHHTMLSTLTSATFSGLRYAELLALSHNKLTFVPANIFLHMRVIITIDLSHNHIRSFASDAFSFQYDTCGPARIYLNNNFLTTIPGEAFGLSRCLKYLCLGENPLHCCDSIPWLLGLRDPSALDNGCRSPAHPATCFTPASANGTIVRLAAAFNNLSTCAPTLSPTMNPTTTPTTSPTPVPTSLPTGVTSGTSAPTPQPTTVLDPQDPIGSSSSSSSTLGLVGIVVGVCVGVLVVTIAVVVVVKRASRRSDRDLGGLPNQTVHLERNYGYIDGGTPATGSTSVHTSTTDFKMDSL